MKLVRLVRLVPVVAAACAFLAPSSASADHHLISVREVFPGSAADAGKDYVELQMYSANQGLLTGHTLTWYTATGVLGDTITLDHTVSHVANQSTVLIGAAASVVGGVTPDFTDTELTGLDPAGGAVCWNASPASFIDCVSWGTFSGNATLPDPQSSSAQVITDGKALRRTIAPNCSTLLESGDDSDASGTDFSLQNPAPRNNASPLTETPCPFTTITKGPSGKTTDRTPTFKFTSSVNPATFECAVDNGAVAPCTSPTTLPKQSFGKHKFKVRASANGSADPTPATRAFKVVKRR
jgi:hypothetical protein